MSGPKASINSPFAPFTPPQRVKLQAIMQGIYDDFVEKAAESRKTTPEKIHAVAQGRVWTGQQARERGLVDALGGLDTAIAIAKETAKIPKDEDVELVVYTGRRTLYEALSETARRRQPPEPRHWSGSDARAHRRRHRADATVQARRAADAAAVCVCQVKGSGIGAADGDQSARVRP